MAIAKLSIDLEARLVNLQAGLDKAGLLAERNAQRMQNAFAGASKALAAAGGAMAAAFSVSVITQWVNRTLEGIDALNDLADATGASVENLSALEDIALRTGTSVDTASDAVVKMNKALADAKPGSDQAAAFKALGLSVEELKRLDPVEAFQKLAIALQGYENDANKARLVQELFGKSLREIAPLLKDVAEAGGLQSKVTKEQAAEAEKFNKQIFEMEKNLLDLSRLLIGPVVAGFNAMSDAIRKIGEERAKGLGLWESINVGLAKQFPQFAFGGSAEQQAMLRNATAAQRALAGINDPANYGNEGRNYVRRLPDIAGGGGGKTSKPKKQEEEFVGPQLPDALSDALKRVQDADESKLQRLRDQMAELVSIVQAGGKVPDSVFAELAADIAKLDPAASDAQKAIEKLSADQERLNAILADTPTGKLDALNEKIEFINKAFADGKINIDQWAEAMKEAADAFGNTAKKDVKKETDSAADAARELGITFSSAFEDAIVNGEKLSDVLKGLEKDILRIVTRKLVTEPLAEGLTGVIKGAVGGGGGGVGSIVSSLFSGFFADGGFIAPGRWGVVGERGPEMAFGGRSGKTISPAGMRVTNVFNLSGPADARTQQQIAAAAARGVERASSRNN